VLEIVIIELLSRWATHAGWWPDEVDPGACRDGARLLRMTEGAWRRDVRAGAGSGSTAASSRDADRSVW
jgi:hypothetical protein